MRADLAKNVSDDRWLHPQCWGWILAIGINGILLWYFHNRFWWGPDDGYFAYSAQRLIDGAILHKDIQLIHPGYVVALNALMMKIFGEDFVSMRYPVMLVLMVQACLLFSLFRKFNVVAAVLASCSPIIFGFLNYLNPNPYWYCIFLSVVLACYLSLGPKSDVKIYFCAGIVVGLAFCFRQLNAVWVAMPVVCYFFWERSRQDKKRGALAILVVSLMTAITLYYLLRATDLTGFMLFGFWPLFVLIWFLRRVRVTESETVIILLTFGAGCVVACLPIVFYHLAHQTLSIFFQDVFVGAYGIVGRSYFDLFSYGLMIENIWALFTVFPNIQNVVDAFYWLGSLLMSFINGAVFFYYLTHRNEIKPEHIIIPLVTIFGGMLSLHMAIPIYLSFSVGLSIVGILWMAIHLEWPPPVMRAFGLALILMGILSVFSHAAKPMGSSYREVLQGNKVGLVYGGEKLSRMHLWIDPKDLDIYSRLVDTIERKVLPDEPILAAPYNPEIYFLSNRYSSARYSNMEYVLALKDGVLQTIRQIDEHPPALVTFYSKDKRNTEEVLKVIDHIKLNYVAISPVGDFEIYLRPDVFQRQITN